MHVSGATPRLVLVCLPCLKSGFLQVLFPDGAMKEFGEYKAEDVRGPHIHWILDGYRLYLFFF